MEVVQKYFKVPEASISVNLDQDDERETLEINVIFPDDELSNKIILTKKER